MGIIIGGVVVLTMLLVASGVMFSTFLDTSVSGAQSLKDLNRSNVQRHGSALNITSGAFDGSESKDLIVSVDNTGSQSVARFGDMDVIVKYTDSEDISVLTRLQYTDSAVGNNQWTVSVTGVQPDSFNPRFWDSDEILYIDLRVNPAVKSGTSALIVVGTPWAVADQSTVDSP